MNPFKALRGQLAKLQRLAQPYFLPVDDTKSWQFLLLVVALLILATIRTHFLACIIIQALQHEISS